MNGILEIEGFEILTTNTHMVMHIYGVNSSWNSCQLQFSFLKFSVMFLIALTALVLVSSSRALSDDQMRCSSLADSYLSKHHKEASPFTGSNMVSVSL